MNADAVFLAGEEMIEAVEKSPPGEHLSLPVITAKNAEEIQQRLSGFLREGDMVFIKGSRSLELEKITEEIANKRYTGG
jgi:UDP-N-acetylmuramyl pentapeptide synthase